MNNTVKIKSSWSFIASVVLVVMLSIAFARGYNSDALYPFSQAKDILHFGSLDGWAFSAVPFTFPDVIVSIPFAAVIDNPHTFYRATAPLQMLIFLLLYAWIYTKQNIGNNFSNVFTSGAIAATAIAIAGTMLFREPFFIVVETMFILVHHGFVGLLAVILFLMTKANDFEKIRKHYILYLVIFILLIASDFYFALYFGCLAATTLNKINWKKVFLLLASFGTLSLLVFVASWKLNPSLYIQVDNSLQINENSKIQAAKLIAMVLLIPTIAAGWLKYKKQSSKTTTQLWFALVIIALMLLSVGLVKDSATTRYLTIAYPVSIILLMQTLLSVSMKSRNILLGLSMVATLSLFVYVSYFKPEYASNTFKEETDCLSQPNLARGTIVAEYWPAKMIFESAYRRHNLLQVDDKLNERLWINNVKWKYLHKSTKTSYIITNLLNKEVIAKLLSRRDMVLVCNDKILVTTMNAESIQRLLR